MVNPHKNMLINFHHDFGIFSWVLLGYCYDSYTIIVIVSNHCYFGVTFQNRFYWFLNFFRAFQNVSNSFPADSLLHGLVNVLIERQPTILKSPKVGTFTGKLSDNIFEHHHSFSGKSATFQLGHGFNVAKCWKLPGRVHSIHIPLNHHKIPFKSQ